MKNQPTLQELSEKLDEIRKLTAISSKMVLKIDEASLLTGYTTGHLYRLTSTKRIPHYKKGRDLFFRKDELERWLTNTPILTQDEVNSKASTYIALR